MPLFRGAVFGPAFTGLWRPNPLNLIGIESPLARGRMIRSESGCAPDGRGTITPARKQINCRMDFSPSVTGQNPSHV
jgi:hypothetical protein